MSRLFPPLAHRAVSSASADRKTNLGCNATTASAPRLALCTSPLAPRALVPQTKDKTAPFSEKPRLLSCESGTDGPGGAWQGIVVSTQLLVSFEYTAVQSVTGCKPKQTR